MKTKITIILIIFCASNIFAQKDSLMFKNGTDSLSKKISLLESKIQIIEAAYSNILQENKSLKNSQLTLNKSYNKLKRYFEIYKQKAETEIDSLQQIINTNTANIKKTADELGVKIDNTQKFTRENVSNLSNKLSKNTLYWIIAILVLVLLLLLVFLLLRKEILEHKNDFESNLKRTRKALEEESIKLDNKLIELLETQLKIIKENHSASQEEPDHSLALKVADEITRLEKNIARMDKDTKGLKPLIKGIERIKDNFKANGYEIIPLLGKEYSEEMNIDVINFIDDESIESGKKIITKIIKPQVNYKGVLIQRAQVDVSQH